MRLHIAAIGRMAPSPERDLTLDYVQRAARTGRPLGVTAVEHHEIEAKKPGKGAEADALRRCLPPGAYLIACDERGEALASRRFSDKLDGLKNSGERDVVFLIGGADGLEEALRDEARFRLAFGPQTWPHALARVMLCEQIYRALSLMAGSPYHRD